MNRRVALQRVGSQRCPPLFTVFEPRRAYIAGAGENR